MPTMYEKIERLFDKGRLDTTYPPSVYEAYLKSREMSFGELMTYPKLVVSGIAAYYVGYFIDRRAFIDDYLETFGVEIPSYLAIDYKTTWEADLRHMFDFVPEDEDNPEGAGWYFRQH